MPRDGYPIDLLSDRDDQFYDFTADHFQGEMYQPQWAPGASKEQALARQRWQARLLQQNPDDMDLIVNQRLSEIKDAPAGEQGTQFKTPAERDAEFEKLLDEFFRPKE